MNLQHLVEQAPQGDLPKRFVAMCVETWRVRFQLPADQLAGAMLAHAVNLIVEDGGADEAAHVLAELAHRLSNAPATGHA